MNCLTGEKVTGGGPKGKFLPVGAAGRICALPSRAPICDRLTTELGPTKPTIFNRRAGGWGAQSRLQAGAPPVLLSGTAGCARRGLSRKKLLPKLTSRRLQRECKMISLLNDSAYNASKLS
jgi:hypothetical protein